MPHKARRARVVGLLDLPDTVVQRIFTIKSQNGNSPVLDLGDRVRMRAHYSHAHAARASCAMTYHHQPASPHPLQARSQCVCTSWRQCLGARALPIEHCSLEACGGPDDRNPFAEWVCRSQPEVHSLRVTIRSGLLGDFSTPAAQSVHSALLSLLPRAVREQERWRVVCKTANKGPWAAALPPRAGWGCCSWLDYRPQRNTATVEFSSMLALHFPPSLDRRCGPWS